MEAVPGKPTRIFNIYVKQNGHGYFRLGAFAEFERNMINSRTSAGREKARAMGVKFGRPAFKIKNGSFIDKKKVIELKSKGLSARAISKFMGCSITPVLKIIKEDIP